jgi:hypothetical protein
MVGDRVVAGSRHTFVVLSGIAGFDHVTCLVPRAARRLPGTGRGRLWHAPAIRCERVWCVRTDGRSGLTVSDLGASARTRVWSIYDLTPRLRTTRPQDLVRVFEYGRFKGHIVSAAKVLPRPAYIGAVAGDAVRFRDEGPQPRRIGELSVVVLATPRGDPILMLGMEVATDVPTPEVVELLVAMLDRDGIMVSGRPIMEWLSEELGLPIPLAFGRHVHHCVFPGGQLREGLLAGGADGQLPPDAILLVHRGRVSADRGGRLGVRTPEALNNPGETLVAHSRGVSLIVGWSEPVENVLALVAATNVAALGVLHRVRQLAFDALEINQSARLETTGAARELFGQLSARLNEVQLDLSFGVEAYVDTVLMPEFVVDSFQASMCDSIGIETGLANTSRMVDRLGAVVHARADALDAAVQEENQRRSTVLTGVLAIGSMIALPPGLLLAFFGVTSTDVDPTTSIIDIERYWIAYGLAWLPFAALVSVGFWLRRRIGRRNMSLLRSVEHPVPRGPTDPPTSTHARVPGQPASSVPAKQAPAASRPKASASSRSG